MSPQKEEFLETLPRIVKQKTEKLQFANNLVLTKQKNSCVTEFETGEEVKEKTNQNECKRITGGKRNPGKRNQNVVTRIFRTLY